VFYNSTKGFNSSWKCAYVSIKLIRYWKQDEFLEKTGRTLVITRKNNLNDCFVLMIVQIGSECKLGSFFCGGTRIILGCCKQPITIQLVKSTVHGKQLSIGWWWSHIWTKL